MDKFKYEYKGVIVRRTNTKSKGAKATQYFIVVNENPIYFNSLQEAVIHIDRSLLNKIMDYHCTNNGRGN